ncbi:MAG TPA: insulinase family protein [Firmicutes bacterium]|nr:insulinase family protein [Bacillota bacterium]
MYERTLLSNGIRVVTEHIPYVRSATIGLWVKTGARDERPEASGISHFIEHMLFKGTKRRSARRIAEEMDAIGGQLNAFTSKEYTCFYAKVLDTHVALAVDILADMFLNSAFDPAELDKERGVIIEEIKMYEDSPDELAHDELARAVWGNRSLGLNIIGSVETVMGLSREDLISHMASHYGPDRIVVSCAGNVTHRQVVELVEKYFSGLEPAPGGVESPRPIPLYRNVFRTKDTEQLHMCIGLPGLPRNHPDRFALYLVDTILGGGMSSRLFQDLREDRGLVYSTYSYHASYEHSGILVIYAAMSPSNAGVVASLIQDAVRKLVREGPCEEELARGKEQLKGNMLLGLESTSNRMSRLAKMELFDDRLYTEEETLDLINAVTMQDVTKLLHDLVDGVRVSIAVVGPRAEDLKDRIAVEL